MNVIERKIEISFIETKNDQIKTNQVLKLELLCACTIFDITKVENRNNVIHRNLSRYFYDS